MSSRLRGWPIFVMALAAAACPLIAADATPVRFRVAGIDSGGASPQEIPKDLDPKKRKAIEKAIRDSQKFAGKKQRVTCQDCLLQALLTIGGQIGQANMRSQSGVAETAGLAATPPYDVALDKDLAEVAQAVNEADYLHKISPRLQFGIPVELAKKDVGRTLAAVKKLDGIAAGGISYDAKESTLWIGVDPEKKLPLSDVVEALKGAGVDVAIKAIAKERP